LNDLQPCRPIDGYLPDFAFSERHAIDVDASPERAYRAVREVTPREVRLLVLLMAIRTLPARLLGRARSASEGRRPILDVALGAGFVRLVEQPPRELVLGAAGRFWTLVPAECVRLDGPEAFLAFLAPDHVKTAVDFRVEELGPGRCRVSTETRIAASDASARRKFGLYWTLVHPGSALIRRAWLRAIKRRAERA
jgi:hypothetical protein